MPTRQELFQRGEAVRQQLQHGAHTASPEAAANRASLGLQRLTTEAVFGAVWGRPGLDMRYRMLCTLSVLSVLQRLPQLHTYILSALTLGLEPRAIVEAFIQCGLYGGFPTMVNALEVARGVFAERGVTVPEEALPEHSLEELETQGRRLRQELQGAAGQTAYASATASFATDLFQFALQYGYGEVWQRPGLERKARVVCAVASFLVLGCEPQLRGFLQAARHVGFSNAEIAEIIMQCAPYGGFPRALNAVAMAQEVLG